MTPTHTTYLSLGTNQGDQAANLQAALDALAPQVTLLAVSPIYQTPPWGVTDQPDFLNLAVQAETALPPLDLLQHLKQIEAQVGRTASYRWGPREIDIDILLYDDLILESEILTIPHPRLHERAFALLPLADLNPNLSHPVLGRTIAQLLVELDKNSIKLYRADD